MDDRLVVRICWLWCVSFEFGFAVLVSKAQSILNRVLDMEKVGVFALFLWCTAYCSSHVTRHSSHVTRHTSHITCHTSQVLDGDIEIEAMDSHNNW